MEQPVSGAKMLADYVYLGLAHPGAPPKVISISVVEAESAEALTAAKYQLTLAGASLWKVPEMVMPVAGVTEVEKKMNR